MIFWQIVLTPEFMHKNDMSVRKAYKIAGFIFI